MRIVENKFDDDDETKPKSRSRTKKNESHLSTPKNPYGNLPLGLPPGLSKSILSPAENSILIPRTIFTPAQKEKTVNIRKQLDEHLLEEDGLEDISNDDLSEEACDVEVEHAHTQSFLSMGQGNRLKF
jgi:hypothetical protein